MKIFINDNEKHYQTPYHAYAFGNIRDMATILEDIQNDTIVSNIGQMFNVTFPINDKLSDEMRDGMQSPWSPNSVPF